MPDFSNAGDIFRSRILGAGLEDTPYPQQAIAGMLGGATPEQLQSFFGSPQVQQQFQQFGIDPQQFTQNIRQSPFLPNQFMQGHPLLGGALTHAMANVAMTPEAPLVSGAGSGMTRAMQGAMGGNDMLRQYQLHQMMAPFGMLGGMMPTYGEQRRRAIEEAIVKETQERMKMLPWQQQMQGEMSDIKRLQAEAAQERAGRPETRFGPYGQDIITNVPARPAGGPSGAELQMQPLGVSPGRQMVDPRTGQPYTVPGWGLTPEQQAGWNVEYRPYDTSNVAGVTQAKQTPEQADVRKSQADLNRAHAGEFGAKAEKERSEANMPGGRYQAAQRERWAKDYNDTEARVTTEKNKIDQLIAAKQLTPEQGAQEKATWDAFLSRAKENFDRQMGKPGQSGREAGTISPGAKTPPPTQTGRGAQAGGAGSQVNQNVAPAQSNAAGLPSGYEWSPQGIPVPIKTQQTAPQQ